MRASSRVRVNPPPRPHGRPLTHAFAAAGGSHGAVDGGDVALGPNDLRGAGVHHCLAAADAGDLLAVDGDAGGRGRRVRRQAAAQGPAGRRCYGLEGFSGTVPSGYEEVHLLWCLVL